MSRVNCSDKASDASCKLNVVQFAYTWTLRLIIELDKKGQLASGIDLRHARVCVYEVGIESNCDFDGVLSYKFGRLIRTGAIWF